MLQRIDKIDSWVQEIIKDDPVRQNLSAEFRINENAEMFALWEQNSLGAVCCVRYTEGIPADLTEMQDLSNPFCDTVVFYTIWSYAKGSGRQLIIDATKEIKKLNSQIKNVVTLSPKTEMAEKFHIRNGAIKWRENEDSINYAYEIDDVS